MTTTDLNTTSDRLLTEVERQQKYLDRLPENYAFPLFNAAQALESQRRSGYRNTASAAREIVDNALEAGATRVDVCFERPKTLKAYQRADSISTIAFIDNGSGMLPEDGAVRPVLGLRARTSTTPPSLASSASACLTPRSTRPGKSRSIPAPRSPARRRSRWPSWTSVRSRSTGCRPSRRPGRSDNCRSSFRPIWTSRASPFDSRDGGGVGRARPDHLPHGVARCASTCSTTSA